jgi:glycosyltransferase involved in cell wall biosynthesis
MKYMPEKTICIITQSHLCNNPRVLKEARTLAENGYAIHVLTTVISGELFQQDQMAIKYLNIHLIPVADLSKRNFQSILDRGVNKLGRLLIKYLGLETSLALGYGSYRYFKKSSAVKADLYICHQELATYIGTRLIKKGFKVAFDFEDWYSEDLLANARAERPINLLRRTESTALNKGISCVTTSVVLAKKLAQTYSCKLPVVIYNVFPPHADLPEKPKEFATPLKLFWFSQTIGPGRGLKEFIYLLTSIETKLELHLLGNVDAIYREKLSTFIPKQHGLYFHKPVSAKKLSEKIAEFDIGLALEMTRPLSRNYTITNKFFQYLQSGLPIIISETDGQNEGFEKFKPGFKLSQKPSNKEITALENWLNDPAKLHSARQRAIAAAHFYNWEDESKKLIQLVDQAFENGG